MQSRRALIIAPRYDGSFLRHLPGAAEVEKRLRVCLEGHGHYEVKSLRKTVRRVDFLSEYRSLIDTKGECLFFFYGHGILRDGSTAIFATSDGIPDDEGVSMSEIIQRGFQSKAREFVMLIDCCHAGAPIELEDRAIERAATPWIKSGRVFIAGSAAHQQGWVEEKEKKNIGIFSWHILQGLEGEARMSNSTDVRGSSLGTYVTDRFRSWNQSPTFIHRETADQRCVITTGFSLLEKTQSGETKGKDKQSKAQIFGVPFIPSQLFVGRNAETDTLLGTLTGGQHQVAVSATVEGLGGVGKTELVIQLLQNPTIQTEYSTIVWLDGAGPLPPQWEKLGETLSLDLSGLNAETVVDRIARCLSERGKTLIVLDNASDWRPVEKLIPKNMSLLVTTRTRDFGGHSFRHLELDILSEEAALSFLAQMVPRLAEDPGIDRLNSTLGGHALALEIAGGTIKALGITATEYLSRLNRNMPSPSQVLNQVKYGNTVEECLSFTWDSLQQDSSRTLWRRASLFAPTSAHRDLLCVSFIGDEETHREFEYMMRRRRRRGRSGSLKMLTRYDRSDFEEAYAELRARNVFSRIEGSRGERWAIHRLVRDFGRARARSYEYFLHAMALSEWLRRPTIDLQPEIPHLIATILDVSRFGTEFQGLSGTRSPSREIGYRSGGILFQTDFFVDFIREELKDPRALTMLLEGLTDINEDVRRQSILLLENLAHIPEVVEGVANSLGDPEPEIRALARRTISEHGTDRIVQILDRTLKTANVHAKVEALRCLAKLGSTAIDIIKPYLKDANSDVRLEAALALFELECRDGEEIIVEQVRHGTNSKMRIRILGALGNQGSLKMHKLYEELLDDSDHEVVFAAFRSAVRSKKKSRVVSILESFWDKIELNNGRQSAPERILNEALKTANEHEFGIPDEAAKKLARHHSWRVRQNSARVLAFSTSRESSEVLCLALNDSDNDVREVAIRSLAFRGDSSCVDKISRMAEDDKRTNVKKAANEALASLGIASSALRNLSRGRVSERVAAARFLGKAKDETAVPVLMRRLSDRSPRVRKEIIRSLGLIGGDSGKQAFLNIARSDRNKEVRLTASTSLLRLRCMAESGSFGCGSATAIEEKQLLESTDLLEALDAAPDGGICNTIMKTLLKSLAYGKARKRAPEFSKFLAGSLDSEDWECRLYAVVGLARANSHDAVDSLIKLLDDPHADVRREAARALGLVGDSRAVSKLNNLADTDTETTVRTQACAALRELENVS